MKYKVIFSFRDEYGNDKQSDYTNDGKGYTFPDARAVARRLREQGHRAEVISMKGSEANVNRLF